MDEELMSAYTQTGVQQELYGKHRAALLRFIDSISPYPHFLILPNPQLLFLILPSAKKQQTVCRSASIKEKRLSALPSFNHSIFLECSFLQKALVPRCASFLQILNTFPLPQT